MNYKVGDKIIWCDEHYEVLEVNGDTGKVKDSCGDIIRNFKFNYGGEDAVVLGSDEK